MAKGSRDWAQLDAFEAEYAERLAAEKKRGASDSPFFRFLRLLATNATFAYTDDIKARDDDSRRLFALRNKIIALREKLAVPADDDGLLSAERDYLPTVPKEKSGLRVTADVLSENYLYPVTFADVRETLATLPPEHAAVVDAVHLTNRKNETADADWGWGTIRLHCVLESVKNTEGAVIAGRRIHAKRMSGQDVERFGGKLEWEGRQLFAVWNIADYRTFVLKRVLIHEVAHGVAE
ncbi:MAG: hypothetical protein H7Y38_20590, partial [Armatimonadetes bacterium]|nr:hypothetical protein [Armatimonadota bacterium]